MAKQKRPLTQRELRAQQKADNKIERVVIINKDKQMVPIQLKAPAGMSFWVGEQTVPLYPKRMATFPKNRLYSEQIRNFKKAGRIQVLNTS
ncbi:MAG: hypothetical protein JRI22_20205 [Deltaproteobacteria bacterium]|nr:hypothetical protein [Deltaproteobacteria bacterium]